MPDFDYSVSLRNGRKYFERTRPRARPPPVNSNNTNVREGCYDPRCRLRAQPGSNTILFQQRDHTQQCYSSHRQDHRITPIPYPASNSNLPLTTPTSNFQPLSSQDWKSVGSSRELKAKVPVDPKMSIGIESEFLLTTKVDALKGTTIQNFVYKLANLYNEIFPSNYPRMSTEQGVTIVNGVYGQVWALVHDSSIEKNGYSDGTY